MCVCVHGNTSLACLMMWPMAASPVPDCVGETKWDPGYFGLASQQQGYILQKRRAVLFAPATGFLTQVPAIVSCTPALLGVLLPGLNSMLLIVGYSAFLGWMGRHLLCTGLGWLDRQSKGVRGCVCAHMYLTFYVHVCDYMYICERHSVCMSLVAWVHQTSHQCDHKKKFQ